MSDLPFQPDEKHFRISQKAAELLGGKADGNGLKADQIRVGRHDTEVHPLSGMLEVTLAPRVTEGQRAGNTPHGTVMTSRQEVFGHIEGLQPQFLKSDAILRRIDDLLEKIPGLGWGMDIVKIPLPETHKEFSVVDKCQKCGGSAKMSCATCNAAGAVPCQNCRGFGFTPCPQCQSSGRVAQADGSQVPCARCMGRGQQLCIVCQNRKTVPCPVCNGNGFTGCDNCGQSGYWTHLYSVAYEAHVHFILDRQSVPQHLQGVLGKLPVDGLGAEGHAEILRGPPVFHEKSIAFPLTALLPVAAAEISVGGKAYPATIAGLNAAVVEIEPFMDALIKPGLDALGKLSKSPVAAAALVETACKYKALRQTLSELAGHSRRVAYQKLVAEYPAILSEKYANAIVRYASQTLLTLSRKQRIRGLVLGTLLTFGLSALYFAGPFKAQVAEALARMNAARYISAVDILIWVLGYFFTLYMIRLLAAQGLRRYLPETIQAAAGLPTSGAQGTYALLTTFLAFIAARALGSGGLEAAAAVLKKIGL